MLGANRGILNESGTAKTYSFSTEYYSLFTRKPVIVQLLYYILKRNTHNLSTLYNILELRTKSYYTNDFKSFPFSHWRTCWSREL